GVNLAMNRLVLEAQRKFGNSATAASFGLLGIDAVGGMIAGGAGPEGMKKQVEGETAELTATVPEEALAMLPKGAQEVVKIWSGAPIRFKKVGTEWRFDIDRSMKVVLQRQGGGKVDEQLEIAAFEASAKTLDGLTAEIHAGSIDTVT